MGERIRLRSVVGLVSLPLFICGGDGSALAGEASRSVRGDVDVNGIHELSDPVVLLLYLYLGDPERIDCEKAADANDDGAVDIGDPIALLFFLFLGDQIPEPFPSCGADPTEDLLTCESFWPCGTGPLVNSIAMKLVPIPAGEFDMGSPETERGRKPDEVLHRVILTCPFYMSETEVTGGQYLRVMGEPPAYYFTYPQHASPGDFKAHPNASASVTTWTEADMFCKKLSALEGRTYRLPTEAEWEYSCRAGSRTRFWFADLLECSDDCCPPCPGAMPYMFTMGNDDREGYRTVAQKKPNPFGLYDMHGTVGEWCRDWYGPYPPGPVGNPGGPPVGARRAVRGWTDDHMGIWASRSAWRAPRVPGAAAANLGFRVVLELPTCAYPPYGSSDGR